MNSSILLREDAYCSVGEVVQVSSMLEVFCSIKKKSIIGTIGDTTT